METSAVTLRAAVLPRANWLTDVALIGGGAGLVALAAQVSIPLPFTPVPITGQTFAALLVGAALGSRRGVASLGLYLLLGIAGAPIYAAHHHGWGVFTGTDGGYLVGFLVAAGLTGWLAEHGWDRRISSSVSAMLTANVVIYLFGLAWLAHVLHTNLNKTLEYGLYPFVPGDVIKLYLAAALLPGAWRLVRRVQGH